MDITVSSFAEFYAAVTDSANQNNTIICPSGAVWDMNDPDKYNINSIPIKCNIQGNNTEIHNFRGSSQIWNSKTITELHFINAFSERDAFLQSDTPSGTSESALVDLQRCRISCQLGASVNEMSKNVRFTRCAMNLAYQYVGGIGYIVMQTQNFPSRYNQIVINAPNATVIGSNSNIQLESSKLVVNAPLATTINNQLYNCIIRGNMQALTSVKYSSERRNISVIDSDNAPLFASQQNIVAATDAQMKDINYLNSIGFQIGSDA